MIVVAHNFASQARLEDIARNAFAYDIDLLVISKASGMAMQSGIPVVNRLAFEKGKNVLITKDLKEAIELTKPDKVILIYDLAEEELDLNKEKVDKNTMLVFFGNYPVKNELNLGKAYCISPKGLAEPSQLVVIMERMKK